MSAFGGGGFDRAAKGEVRVRRALQELQARVEQGTLIPLDDPSGLSFDQSDPPALSVKPDPPIQVTVNGVGLTLADPSGLTVSSGALAVAVVDPLTVSASGVGVSILPPLALSGGAMALTLAATPALEDVSGLRLRVNASGGIARTAAGAELNIPGLTSETANDDADSLAVFDASAGAHRRMTRANFLLGFASVPTGAIVMVFQATPPADWLLLNGDTIGNTGSGATHTGPDLEDLFDIVKTVTPNAGTESFVGGNTVTLPDMRRRIPIGVTPLETEIDAAGETSGAWDHTHTVNPAIASTSSPIGTDTVDLHSGFSDPDVPVDVASESHTHNYDVPSTVSSAANPPVLAVHFVIKV